MSPASLFLIFVSLNLASCLPNFVFFLTDDQDLLLNGLKPIEQTLKLVANEGATLDNYFVNTPICCPSRSSILTGNYTHNIGVWNNSIRGNCYGANWRRNSEPYTIAPLLKRSNYTTFYAGKYLNQYGLGKNGTKQAPPGYDWWFGLVGNSRYYNYTLSVNGSAQFFDDYYLTDHINDLALKFLAEKTRDKPFFMLIAPPAPHAPFTPAERHKNAFVGERAVRNPAFNHTAHKKHWLVGMDPPFLPSNVENLDNIQRQRLQTLLAVDEMVEKVINKLNTTGEINNTYIIYSSDNGFHIGQFGQPWDKRQPYNSDIRVPFFIRGPLIKPKTLIKTPITAVDIAPTILDLAGENKHRFDGKSFKGQLFRSDEHFNSTIFLEYFGESGRSIDNECFKGDLNVSGCGTNAWCKCEDSKNNTYICLLKIANIKSFKYCQFYDDDAFVEIYDLTADPFELNNIHSKYDKNWRKLKGIVKKFKHCTGEKCRTI